MHDEPFDDNGTIASSPGDLRTMEGWVRWGRTVIEPQEAGTRLDQYLAKRFTYRSRTGWVSKIREGRLRVGGRRVRPSYALKAGDLIEYRALPLPEPPVDTNCPIIHEDDAILAVSKSGNIPVHPSGRYFLHTVLHVLGRDRRDGWLRIVHRIDRETSGVLIFAKSLAAARSLTRQFEDRLIEKAYLSVVWGHLAEEQEIDAPLGPNPRSEVRKSVGVVPGGRSSRTHVLPLAHGREVTLVEARPLTGRLHQIRVHLKSIGHPVVGDKLYGKDERMFIKASKGHGLTDEDYAVLGWRRQALHAWKLALKHPATGRRMMIQAVPPRDFRDLMEERGLDGEPVGSCMRSAVRWEDAESNPEGRD